MTVDPNIKKKANDIRTKIYGKEVRESLASGLEEMSSDVVENEGRQSVVESRQDSVESQWQSVSDEMTDKDVISAPEIIAARNGEANLKTRIDKDHQEVTAQLAQTVKVVDVTNYRAKADGVTDSTQAINEAIIEAVNLKRPLYIPKGESEYMIDVDVSIKFQSNLEVYIDDFTSFKAIPTDTNDHDMFAIHDVENLKIHGRYILNGNRENMTATDGEWGFGLSLRGTKNVDLGTPFIYGFWGDGIYIGVSHTKNYCENTLITRPYIDNCRRQGISVISAENLTIDRPIIKNTNGTAPQLAIDFEPNNSDERLVNIEVIKPIFIDNSSGGIGFYMQMYQGGEYPVSIKIIEPTNTGGLFGYLFAYAKDVEGTIEVINPISKNTRENGINVRDWDYQSIRIKIDKPVIINGTLSNTGNVRRDVPIAIIRQADTDVNEGIITGNVWINEPTVLSDTASLSSHAISITDYKPGSFNNLTKNVEIINPKQLDSSVAPIFADGDYLIEDKNNVLELGNLVGDGYNIPGSNAWYSYKTRATSAPVIINILSERIPNNQKIHFHLNNDTPFTLTTDSVSILPYGNSVTTTSGNGASITMIKKDEGLVVVNEVGNWTSS